jgi:hypothetical protein
VFDIAIHFKNDAEGGAKIEDDHRPNDDIMVVGPMIHHTFGRCRNVCTANGKTRVQRARTPAHRDIAAHNLPD